jgi:hypothetical protein
MWDKTGMIKVKRTIVKDVVTEDQRTLIANQYETFSFVFMK